MSLKVFIANSSKRYEDMFLSRGWELARIPQAADLIQFTGGADVSPRLYGQEPHPTTRSDGDRDNQEEDLYKQFVGKKPMAGICRGAQFLWVMNGGELYQDIEGHATGRTHPIYKPESQGPTSGDLICQASSTHHQAMAGITATTTRHKLLAIATGLSGWRKYWHIYYNKFFTTCPDGTHNDDIEVAAFPDTKCLCFQPHPEHGTGECQDYYFELVWNYLLNKG